MCGIVGVAGAAHAGGSASLLRMRDTMVHRGPDDGGEWWADDSCTGLGHRRLSIIDLSPGGHQPMRDESGKLTIVFNGEIYNFRELRDTLRARGSSFRTDSDTEVLLAAYREWGTDCLAHVNGMFAFALHDAARRRVFLARDRAGEKPLFYRHAGGRLAFASELKALLDAPDFERVLELEALDHYLAFGYVPGDMCILRGVRKLPPAHAATYDMDADRLETWRYWSLPPEPSQRDVDAGALVDRLDSLLEDAVRRQLVADVPVGILLSGGLDSSLVTAMAARVSSSPVRTFTVSFPGHGSFDEGPYARTVAEHFGTDHTELQAEPASVELLPELARQYDEPMADSSMVPTYLVSKLIRQHATVALGGDGGDELFGGYTPYGWLLRQDRARRFIPRPVRAAVAGAAARAMPPGMRGRKYVIGYGADLAESAAHSRIMMDALLRERLLAPVRGRVSRRHPAPESFHRALLPRSTSPVRTMTALDFLTYLPDDILVKVDRASMLTSLEVRAPWLDYRLVEFAFGEVPDSLRATTAERKILPRRLAERLLPPALDLQRKQGFSIPLHAWFKGSWGRYFEEVLGDASSDLFDRGVIGRLLEGQRRGRANTNQLFALTLFELWRREYRVSLP